MSKPNVLLICTDHWPGSLLGCAGHPTIHTPTLDDLARNGILFRNAYSECPVCVPARRTLMTGLLPRSHGMLQNAHMPMPDVPTLAACFGRAGYQTSAVGKLHVQPQRQRIGFDEVLLDEEGRGKEGAIQDDYELFLGDHGYPGQRFAGGMNNNEYVWRPWHLPERFHVTGWAASMMARQIRRRDPLRPGFWYLSFSHPHPPQAPLQAYLDLYREFEPPEPHIGDWARPREGMPSALRAETHRLAHWNERPDQIRAIRRAFYAQCTHIDHQIRMVIGTLREEGLLDDTIVCFTADHGDMLGNHRMWAKHQMYDDSNRVPLILMGTRGQMLDGTVGHHRADDRLVGLADLMPTLLELAGLPVPAHVEGRSIVAGDGRELIHGLWGGGPAEGMSPTRMVRDARYKLVYYPVGNVVQLFDMVEDPREMRDLADDSAHSEVRRRLEREMALFLRASDEDAEWVDGDRLVGLPEGDQSPRLNRGLSGQRGLHWPPPAVGSVPWS
jgi:arylsulfatase A-like enzyme